MIRTQKKNHVSIGRVYQPAVWFSCVRHNRLTRMSGMLILSLLVLAAPLVSRAAMVPEWDQMMIFLKVLTYDRTISTSETDTLKIGVLFDSRNASSVKSSDEIIRVLKANQGKTINNHQFAYELLDSNSQTPLRDSITNSQVSILYITIKQGSKLPEVIETTRDLDILTLTGVEEYIKQGVAISIGIRGGAPRIILNLNAIKAEGHEFNSNLYRVCEVIR